MQVENRCRITGVTNPIHLRASHCKPWRDSSNEERISGENGLLLTPTMDHLFDRGFISFEDSGLLIVSPVAHPPSLNLMGVATATSSMSERSLRARSSFLITTENRFCCRLGANLFASLHPRTPKLTNLRKRHLESMHEANPWATLVSAVSVLSAPARRDIVCGTVTSPFGIGSL